MAIVIEDVQVERLAEQLASAEGVSVAEVVRESLLSLANLRGVIARKPAFELVHHASPEHRKHDSAWLLLRDRQVRHLRLAPLAIHSPSSLSHP